MNFLHLMRYLKQIFKIYNSVYIFIIIAVEFNNLLHDKI